jgi:hypothetical protein
MKTIREKFLAIIPALGTIATVIAYWLKTDQAFIYSIILGCTFLGMLVVILVEHYFPKNKEQSAISIFFKNDLPPNKSKTVLEFKTEIVIIEDETDQSFSKSLKEKFKTISDEESNGISDKKESISKLDIIPFPCKSSDEAAQKSELEAALEGVEAVIVVRTKELEEKSWVYETLEAWATQNSHAPCLVIEKIDSQELERLRKLKRLSPVPERYYFIPDAKGSLPWRLLKRANERALAWRNQASFNRSIAISVFIFLLTGLMVGYFIYSLQRSAYENLLQTQRSDYENLLRDIYYKGSKDYASLQQIFGVIAKETKGQYERSITGSRDDKLNVSYWVNRSGTIYQLSTTEEGQTHRNWRVDEPSIIGCGFAHPNSSVQWDETMARPLVSPYNGEASPEDNICKYGSQNMRKLKSIVCTTFNDAADPENTVGVCVFTESGNNDVSKKSTDFLKERTMQFYNFIFPLLKDKKLIPQ